MRRNGVGMDVPARMGDLAVRQHLNNFAGQTQRGTSKD
jgi:hypothetical protein